MMATLLHYFAVFNVYAKANPMIAAAVSLWGLSTLTWLCKGVPIRIYRTVKGQVTTKLTFTSQSVGMGLETYANFLRWFEGTRWARWSRSLSIKGSCSRDYYSPRTQDDGTVVGVGEGSHFFFYRGCPFWMEQRKVQGNSTRDLIYEIEITGLGRNRRRILELIEEFRYKPDPKKLGVFTWSRDDWTRIHDVITRPLPTVVIRKDIKDALVNNIQRWLDARDWFESRGLPYKLTCILRGIPGTGKTSLIKALASHFNMNVCMLNLSTMTDATFEESLSGAPSHSIVVIEDFDSSNATKARSALKQGPNKTELAAVAGNQETLGELMNMGLTLSGILNALDGILSLDGKIIFMTTNVYEAIDPALLRKGRVDYTYELAALGDEEVRTYIHLMFPEASIPAGLAFDDILGCDLQALYFEHRDDVTGFIAAIPKATRRELKRA